MSPKPFWVSNADALGVLCRDLEELAGKKVLLEFDPSSISYPAVIKFLAFGGDNTVTGVAFTAEDAALLVPERAGIDGYRYAESNTQRG